MFQCVQYKNTYFTIKTWEWIFLSKYRPNNANNRYLDWRIQEYLLFCTILHGLASEKTFSVMIYVDREIRRILSLRTDHCLGRKDYTLPYAYVAPYVARICVYDKVSSVICSDIICA